MAQKDAARDRGGTDLKRARVLLVALVMCLGLTAAYFGVNGQEVRAPWPPRPIKPPEAEESEPSTTAKNSKTPPPPVFPTGTKAKEPPPPLPTPTPILSEVKAPEAMAEPAFPLIPQVTLPVEHQASQAVDAPAVAPPPPINPVTASPPPVPLLVDSNKPKTLDNAPNKEAVAETSPSFRIVSPIRRPGQLGGPSLVPDPTNKQSPMGQTPETQTGVGLSSPALATAQTPKVLLEKIGPARLKAGERQQFAIVVKNHGDVPARNVRIDDELPTSLSIVSSNPQPALQSEKGLTWLISVLLPGEEQTIRFDVQAANAVYLNSAVTLTVSSASQRHSVNRVPSGPLALSVQGPASGVAAGQPAVLEIKFANRSQQLQRGLILRVSFPPGLSHPMGTAIEGEVGELAVGGERMQKLTVTAKLAGRHVVEVELSGPGGEKAAATAEVLVLGNAGAALEVRQAAIHNVLLERDSELKIEVSNPQAQSQKNVMVLNTLPAGLEFSGASDRGLFQQETRTAHWLIETLPAGQTRTVTLRVRGKAPGQFHNEVVARTESREEVRSTAKVQVEGRASLAVTLRAQTEAVEVGRSTVYEIHVINQGTTFATGITVTASLPEGMAGGNCGGPTPFRLDGQQVTFGPLARLEPKGEAKYLISALAQAPGAMRFLAQVSCDQERTPIVREKRTSVYNE